MDQKENMTNNQRLMDIVEKAVYCDKGFDNGIRVDKTTLLKLLTKECLYHLRRKSNQERRLRNAVADYIRSEGCDCCEDGDTHKESKAKIAKLLNVSQYTDGSGYNFTPFETPRPE